METATRSADGLAPGELALGEEITDVQVSADPGVRLSVRLARAEAEQFAAVARKEGLGLLEAVHASVRATIAAGRVSGGRAEDGPSS